MAPNSTAAKDTALHLLEKPMDKDALEGSWGCPQRYILGATSLEWELGKESLGWEDFPDELIINSDSGITKPSPEGLEILCRRLGAASPVFFGDTASDMQAQAAFGGDASRGRSLAAGGRVPL